MRGHQDLRYRLAQRSACNHGLARKRCSSRNSGPIDSTSAGSDPVHQRTVALALGRHLGRAAGGHREERGGAVDPGQFVQQPAAGRAQPGGSGLGLAIVQDIAVLHGAQLELSDGAGGQGLNIIVRFPPVAGPADK